jgi:hypothetical protein
MIRMTPDSLFEQAVSARSAVTGITTSSFA